MLRRLSCFFLIAAVLCQEAHNDEKNEEAEVFVIPLSGRIVEGGNATLQSGDAVIKRSSKPKPNGHIPGCENAKCWTAYYTYESIPKYFNWADRGIRKTIRDQYGTCASCWATASATLVELMYDIEHWKMPSRRGRPNPPSMEFTENELLDCFAGGDCKSHTAQQALEFGHLHGFTPANEFSRSKCSPKRRRLKLETIYNIYPNERSIASYIVKHGPVILNFCFTIALKDHAGGTILGRLPECKGKGPNHAVVAVGFGEYMGQKYWILQNSWGPYWGNSGYFWWVRGENDSGIEKYPLGASFLKDGEHYEYSGMSNAYETTGYYS